MVTSFWPAESESGVRISKFLFVYELLTFSSKFTMFFAYFRCARTSGRLIFVFKGHIRVPEGPPALSSEFCDDPLSFVGK